AHADGLVIGGQHAVPLLQEGLGADEPEAAFAAAYPLLLMKEDQTVRLVLEAFLKAGGGCRAGLRQALCHGSISAIRPQLKQALASPSVALAAAAAEVLAFHSFLELTTAQFERFLKHEKAEVRQAGWRAASMSVALRPETYEAGLGDPDPEVRREAL